MRNLYTNKEAVQFNGKSMFLKLHTDAKKMEEEQETAFRRSSVDPRLKKNGIGAFWDCLPNNIV
jgi:hypothetical protein